ncbi:HNH endonuclease [Pusillimonas sp. TS35]|uniref:ABC-three component system protein n=1 Tax=Paracandidimonas lactea TaxID=2895524 RepID=UPI00136EE6E6|nr:ABC-three component system protein [Paracandidimonas lactea]MYN13523.1 HNH endonuclease [Pusillimonas sp. TS35]
MTTKKTAAAKKPNSRPSIGIAFELSLCAEVNNICPNCAQPLFRTKGGRNYKDYEIAHIYPLNPTPTEEELLKSETRLSANPNDAENLIPLCFSCHKVYDTPKTAENYRDLVQKKKAILLENKQRNIFLQYALEREISEIIDSLCDSSVDFEMGSNFEAKRVDRKLDSTIRPLTKRKIKNDVSSFYLFVRERFSDLERADPNKAVLVAQQIKSFYLKQKTICSNQQEIFDNTVRWIQSKHTAGSTPAAEVIAAFFVQNCELFE